MATAVGIMDREGWDQRTDILVVVRPELKEVLWVPRDLYCLSVNHRINHAFERGGHALLHKALFEQGIKVDDSICVKRSAVERVFLDYKITVPVAKKEKYYYPLSPQQPIEDGRKIVEFSPPEELLWGERFHHWMGARVTEVEKADATGDLVRLRRQQILLRRLLEEKFDFTAFKEEELNISSSEAFRDLAKVRSDWKFYTLQDVEPVNVRKMYVFVRSGQVVPGQWIALKRDTDLEVNAL